MHGGSGRDAGRWDGDAKPAPTWRRPLHPLHEEKEKFQSESPASNINQPVTLYAAGRAVGHTVESGRQQAPPDESAGIAQFG